MASLIYPSAFASEFSEPASSSSGQAQPTRIASNETNERQTVKYGGFTAFTCHVAYLEHNLHRGEKSRFFNGVSGTQTVAREQIGHGASFFVDRVEQHANGNGADIPPAKRYVAIKTVKEQPMDTVRWREILFEIRALLHEPLRYHPNIVRLLDIGWGASSETGSSFPALVLEYAEFGTLDQLQRSNASPLPFRIKQKLCYDIGRGLSILHGCGVVHGDLKHENVLIFRNQYDDPPGQPYTAKLADFGGAVMDMNQGESFTLPMGTIPYSAPEMGQRLTADGIKKTDTYSYGMLVWRCLLDCHDLLVAIDIRKEPGPATLSAEEEEAVKVLKESDELVDRGTASVAIYCTSLSMPQEVLSMLASVLICTIRTNPALRALDRAEALLRGMSSDEARDYVSVKDLANERRREAKQNSTPGEHGIDVDSVGYGLGRLGNDYDAQNNLPGYRPDLPRPDHGGFLFEPLKLKKILSWLQQVEIVKELERIAISRYIEDSTELQPWTASYYLFQAHLANFGVQLDPVKACYWLYKTSIPQEVTASTDYWAKAWLTRVCAAMDVPIPLMLDEQVDNLFWSIIRGHRNCLEDASEVISMYPNETKRTDAWRRINEAEWVFRTLSGGTGMPHYAPRKLRRPYNLQDMDLLHEETKKELGNDYEACLRSPSDSPNEKPPDGGYRFDKIYVNHKGHGLLHMAATMGNLTALTNLYRKYKCDINVSNKSVSESPLVCACRSGHSSCAIFLLDNGATANGSELGEEAPLHWLSSFPEAQMRDMAQRLMDGGADTERCSGGMRKDVRQILADWEDTFGMPLTPLGRAVLMKSLGAVKVLLEVAGADPTHRMTKSGVTIISAVELASVLTLPDILQVLLDGVDKTKYGDPPHIYDECEMLEAAHDMKHTRSFDPLSLQSRIIRCGVNYKHWLVRTLRILSSRRERLREATKIFVEPMPGKALCREVSLGNVDIVEALLDLGHDINGSPDYRPLEAAVQANNQEIFSLLVERGALLDVSSANNYLELLASRPHTFPSGMAIAQYLIDNGVPVETQPTDCPSTLAIAVRNRYFDLADLLIAHGAGESINSFFKWSPESEPMSVLGLLLQSHTFASLQSIEYLTQKHNDDSCHIRLQPLISASTGLTSVHLLGLFDPKKLNNRAQVSACIIQHILEMFPSPASLGKHAIHSECGTPLTAAIRTMNEPVISALLESAYRSDVTTAVVLPVLQPTQGSDGAPAQTIPAMLAFAQVLDRVELLEAADNVSAKDLQGLLALWELAQSLLAHHKTVVDSLRSAYTCPLGSTTSTTILASSTPDGTTLDANYPSTNDHRVSTPETTAIATVITVKIAELQHKLALQTQISHLSLNEYAHGETQRPVIDDLSVLTEEKATDWVEGDDMDQETASRIFLRYLRHGDMAHPIDRFMDQTYNKRRKALRAQEFGEREWGQEEGR